MNERQFDKATSIETVAKTAKRATPTKILSTIIPQIESMTARRLMREALATQQSAVLLDIFSQHGEVDDIAIKVLSALSHVKPEAATPLARDILKHTLNPARDRVYAQAVQICVGDGVRVHG